MAAAHSSSRRPTEAEWQPVRGVVERPRIDTDAPEYRRRLHAQFPEQGGNGQHGATEMSSDAYSTRRAETGMRRVIGLCGVAFGES